MTLVKAHLSLDIIVKSGTRKISLHLPTVETHKYLFQFTKIKVIYSSWGVGTLFYLQDLGKLSINFF